MVNKMKFSKESILIIAVVVGSMAWVVMADRQRAQHKAWQEEVRAKLRAEIRDEFTQKFQTEIDKVVSQKVAAEVAKYAQNDNSIKKTTIAQDLTTTATVPVAPSDISKAVAATTPESIDQAIRRTVKEVVAQYQSELSDEELSGYVASGGLDPAVKIPGGILKESRSEMELAAVTNSTTGKPAAKIANKKSVQKAEPATTETTAGSKERAESLERTLAQKGSILLPKGKLQFEPSFTYAHFSSNRINIDGFSILPILVVGTISTETVKRDIFIQTMSLKYGLLNNFQTELRIPSRYEFDRISNTAGTEDTTRSTGGIGDISMGVSRQIGWESGGMMPDLVASLSVKSDTGRSSYGHDIGIGTGHWAVSSGLVAAKASDPAVIFGSMSYTYNIERNVDSDYGTIKPGDSIGYSIGTAIALSYQTAINFSFDQSLTMKMTKNGETVPNSFQNSSNFKTGFNWALSERQSVDLGVSFGLTTDSPDFTVDVRFPYLF